MPIFALANAGIELGDNLLKELFTPLTVAVALGLTAGKFIGIMLSSSLLIKLGLAELPPQTTWKQMTGVAFLAGIGFTMSLFIAELAYDDPELIAKAKLGVLIASLISGVIGYFILRSTDNATNAAK
jgi:NhaA family Na+:H+ antiporter